MLYVAAKPIAHLLSVLLVLSCKRRQSRLGTGNCLVVLEVPHMNSMASVVLSLTLYIQYISYPT